MSDPTERPSSTALSQRPRDSIAFMGQNAGEFLAFVLDREYFAIPLGAVREILKYVPITEVPRSQPYVLGILSVRGRITTVIDLRRRLRMPESPITKQSRILLVECDGEIIGVLVDEVVQVHRLAESEVEVAAVVSGELSEYVLGVGRPGSVRAGHDDGEILVLLDPGPLLRR